MLAGRSETVARTKNKVGGCPDLNRRSLSLFMSCSGGKGKPVVLFVTDVEK
jgi:hypothetical protein